MNAMRTRFLPFFLSAIIASISSYGANPCSEEPARVTIHSSSTTVKKKHRKPHSRNSTSLSQTKCLGCSFSKPYQPTYYIKGIGAGGGTLAMNDETVWLIAGNSTSIVNSWAPNSPIVITPARWYSTYGYYIKNLVTNESATAKLSQGPFMKYAIFIEQIDWNQGYIYLSNGTQWAISSDYTRNPWIEGQAVLIGENAGWTKKGYILVNINEDNYLEASYLR